MRLMGQSEVFTTVRQLSTVSPNMCVRNLTDTEFGLTYKKKPNSELYDFTEVKSWEKNKNKLCTIFVFVLISTTSKQNFSGM